MSGVLLTCLEATLWQGQGRGDYYRLTLVRLAAAVVVASSAYVVRVAGTQGATHTGQGAVGGVSPGLGSLRL